MPLGTRDLAKKKPTHITRVFAHNGQWACLNESECEKTHIHTNPVNRGFTIVSLLRVYNKSRVIM